MTRPVSLSSWCVYQEKITLPDYPSQATPYERTVLGLYERAVYICPDPGRYEQVSDRSVQPPAEERNPPRYIETRINHSIAIRSAVGEPLPQNASRCGKGGGLS